MPTLAGLVDAYFNGGKGELNRQLDGVGNCPDCWRRLVVELIHQTAGKVLHNEFGEP